MKAPGIAVCFWLVGLLALVGPASAQTIIGQCNDQMRGQAFAVADNGYSFQIGNPANNGYAVRDPSGVAFLRFPSVNPLAMAFFAAWDGSLVQIDMTGQHSIGFCQFNFAMPQNPYAYVAPQMGNTDMRLGTSELVSVPAAFGDPQQRFVPPLAGTAENASQCMQSSADREDFADCMVRQMAGKKEVAVYDCARSSADTVEMAFCTVGAVGGENERKAARQLQDCYQQYGTDLDTYALCMADKNSDEQTKKIIGCVKGQLQSGDVSMLQTAACVGGAALNLNPELQIAVQCATTTGGQPMAFAACTGGQLTARELNKCFEKGIGGDGCFGEGNEIVKGLKAIGVDMTDVMGPNNDVVRNWNNAINDIQNGPGPNNDGIKAVTTIANDLANGPGPNNDIVKALDNVFSGFSF